MTRKLMQMTCAKLAAFGRKEDGAAIVEYGIALLVVVAIGIGAFSTFGESVGKIFEETGTTLENWVEEQESD